MNEMEPLVSVIITTYNYGEYIEKAVNSVLSQTYNNIEIIIINDGSTDNTEEIIKKYIEKPKIVYVKQKNTGQARSKNVGAKKANGEYIAFLDADDYYFKEKIKMQMDKILSDTQIGVVYTRAKWIDKENKEIKRYTPKPYSGKITNQLLIDNFITFSSVLLKKKHFIEVGCLDETLLMGIDWDLWLKISKICEFAYINKELVAYRVGHPNQMSKKQSLRKQQTDYIYNRFVKNNSELLLKKYIRKAEAYKLKNEAELYAYNDYKKFIRKSLKSLWQDIYQPVIYIRILKISIRTIFKKLLAYKY